ncbi:Hypothetical predicted protein [Mytilus galloprovincialis]|uniref:Uncharacterized protein n=1 Tax=Mytilus galloprovincialis TaxID=29158 RepID=A0A8B6G2G5_MYTGA|nr:Hypothetical predicted protein [Mytilus galloprovincialis]
MEKLPKPLVALINSIVDEYEHFTWNSNYLGDKMRISLIWTRGEYVNTNKGVKHKSKSSKARDTKRLKTWQDKKENLHNDDDIDTSDIDTDSSEEDMSESSDENQQIDKVDIPLVAPEKVNIRPVTKITHPVRVSINKSINKNNHESPPEKRVCRSSICGTSVEVQKQSVHTNIKECEHVEIDDEIKTVASKSIITGNSPCNDSHYQKNSV